MLDIYWPVLFHPFIIVLIVLIAGAVCATVMYERRH